MRKPRFLLPVVLPVLAALTVSGCMRGDLAAADAKDTQSEQGRGFFSSGATYAWQPRPAQPYSQQQAAAQPLSQQNAAAPPAAAEEGRGFFSSGRTYALQPEPPEQAYAQQALPGESSIRGFFASLTAPPQPKLKSYVLQYHPPAEAKSEVKSETKPAPESAPSPQPAPRIVASAPPAPQIAVAPPRAAKIAASAPPAPPPEQHEAAPPAAAPQYTGSVAYVPYAAGAPYYASVLSASEGPYTLGAGDKLRVVVFGQAGLTSTYIVDASGNVSIPLIGTVAARGRTTQTLSHAITAKLKQGYVRDPHVSVEIETYRPFFILGEVTTPGQYPYVAHMTAETAVAIAGGFAPRAYKDDLVLTRNVAGGPVTMTVPFDTPLRPGDMVKVKERWF
jgi:Polysaccharide biosynthesis/export protein/SLBB domain